MSVLSRVAGRSMVNMNRVAAGVLAGALAGGVVGGIGARIAMRFVAIFSGATPGFSLGGTLGIIIIGAIFGLIFGLVYAAASTFLPGSGAWNGLFFGAILFVLFIVLPFGLFSQGELALVPPWLGILLFGPVPLAYGAVLGGLLGQIEARLGGRAGGQVGIAWLVLFGVLLTISLIGAFSLADLQLIFPSLFVAAYKALGISFAEARIVHALLVLGFILAYCGMTGVLLWSGANVRMARFATLALLAFSAAFFHEGQVFSPAMASIFVVRWLPGIIQAAGLLGLLLLFFWFPDGQFTPSWTKPAAIGLAGLMLVVFVGFSGSEIAANLEVWLGAITLACGALALGWRYYASHDQRLKAQIRPFLVTGIFLFVYYLLLAIGVSIVPSLQAWNSHGMDSLFAFAPYLLPWLLLPAVLLWSMRRRDLWVDGNGSRV